MIRRIAAFVAFVLTGMTGAAGDGGPAAAAAQAPSSDLQIRVGFARPGGGYTIASMPLEAYVARVVAGEAARDSPPAALDALAVTVRTFALANRHRHAADGFDLCDETHCQVLSSATSATERSATRTAGRVLLSGGAPASIYYSASCGGQTEVPSAVWPGAEDPPYLPSQPDDACGGAPAWSAELSEADLVRALRAGGFRGRLTDVRIASRNGSGRVARLRLSGLTPETVSGQDLRVMVGRTLGWQFIKSTAFELTHDRDRYRFTGHGSGHGVGLCVIGSTHLAAAGRTADAILHRYFPGLVIGRVPAATLPAGVSAAARPVPPAPPGARRGAPAPPPPTPSASPTPLSATAVALAPALPVGAGVLVSLPAGDDGELGVITDLAAKARSELSRALGVAPPRVALRFHPTVDSYERATREPWFTAAAIRDGEINLLPPTVLRDRGVLDRTIRQQIVRAIVDEPLARRPLWVREGAALYFAAQSVGASASGTPTATTGPCPGDAELRNPVSAGSLSTASARALACFARQIARGRSWRDVR